MFVFCLQTVLRIHCQILLLSLTTWGVIAENHQLFLSKNKYIENKVLTAGTVGYIAEMSSVGIVHCSMACAAYKSGCGGLFYHPQSESCKLLTSPLTEALAYDVRLGWSFWSQNPCEIGWFYSKDQCYFRDQTSLNWASAKLVCEQQSSYLAEVDSFEENNWITENMTPFDCLTDWMDCVVWLGGSDILTEGSFVWSTNNRTLTFTHRGPYDPNAYTADDDCVALMYPGGQWADFGCFMERHFVCEKNV